MKTRISPDIEKSIPALMRELRKEKQLTIVQFSHKLGVAHPRVIEWEKGRVRPGFNTFMNIIDALGKELVIQDKGGDEQVEDILNEIL